MEGSSAEIDLPTGDTLSDAAAEGGDSTVDAPVLPRVPACSADSTIVSESKRKRRPSKHSARSGSIYGDFRVEEFVGGGSMGEVYRATQLSLARTVALKILPGDYTENSNLVKRFLRESQSLAELDHPNIVKIYGTGVEGSRYFAALEYVDGPTLQDVLDAGTKFEVGDALHVALVCAQALEHAHGRGIVHRDIKPANILLTQNGMSKIADFGLVKMVEQADLGMTDSGTGLGTPEYMPPEQAFDARSADPRSDIYSVGIMLYVLLTGQLPFRAKNTVEYVSLKQRGKFTAARELNSAVPERLDLILQKLLQPEPDHRYSSCAELQSDLGSLRKYNPTLSFLDVPAKDRFVAIGSWSSVASKPVKQHKKDSTTKPSDATKASVVASKVNSASAKTANVEKMWYIAHKNKLGKPVLSKMMSGELIGALRNRLIPVTAQVKTAPNERFRSLADYSEFLTVLEELDVKIQKRSAQPTTSKKRKKRRKKKSEWLDLLIKVVIGAAAAYGVIRGSIDLFSTFKS